MHYIENHLKEINSLHDKTIHEVIACDDLSYVYAIPLMEAIDNVRKASIKKIIDEDNYNFVEVLISARDNISFLIHSAFVSQDKYHDGTTRV